MRSEKEKEIRFKCFVYIHEIIEKSHIYQEWKKEYRYEYIKVSGKKKYEKKLVECFGLVWIIDQKDGYKTRIKVVIKKVVWWKHAEMISVIPGRQIKWYNKLFFEETKKSNI